MKLKDLLLFLLFLSSLIVFSQEENHDATHHHLLEDSHGHLIQNLEEQKEFLKIREEKRKFEQQNLNKANITSKTGAVQQAVEMCTNGGLEQYETINGNSYLKNFLYNIGDPAGPTQCRSISNTANSYINRFNPSNLNIMATGVPANYIDTYMGDIKAFDQYALKINYENSSTYGSIVQGKRFKTNNEKYLKFNYKAVLQTVYDNSHTDNQPFVKARILDKKGSVVNEICLVGDEKNCIFTKVPSQTSHYVTLYTANWQSGLLDISSLPNNEEFTIEFMASRCGLGGHFGYMYVDDICLLHSTENLQGSVELEPLNKVCSTLPISVCGNYTIPNSGGISASLKKITLTVYDSSNIAVYSTSTTSSLDTANKTFCFLLKATDFPDVSNANYNVGVKVDYDISGTSCSGTTFNSAIDADANPGWDISFLNCTASCDINVKTAKISQCDSNRDGTENFDLTKLNPLVVNTTTGLNFSYYMTYDEAVNNLNAISNPTSYLSPSTSIYVKVNKDVSCYKIISASLELRNPTANITGILNVCAGSTVLTTSPGASYLWSTGETTQNITITSIGTYSVTVTDSFGCSSEANVVIESSQTAVLPTLQITQPSCFSPQGTIKVTSPAAQYSFDDGVTWTTNDTKSNLNPGTYLVKIKTVNGCTSYSQSVTIKTATTLYPQYTSTNPKFCGDVGTITILGNPAYFSFDDGVTWVTTATASNLGPGNYKIRTKDSQGCISSASNVLISSNTLATPFYTLINPACSQPGSITINTVSDFYTFDGGVTWVKSNTKNILNSGTFAIGIKNAIGCTSNFTYVYANDLKDTFPEYGLIYPECGNNGSIIISTVADFYSFDGGVTWTTDNIANVPHGNYLIKVKNKAGCISQASFVNLYRSFLPYPTISIEQPTCGTNGKITINSLADYYSYDNGVTWTTLNSKSLPPGIYSVLIKNNLGCISYSTPVYLYNPNIDEPSYTVTQPSCTNLTGSITINTTADYYSFDGGYTWKTTPTLSNISSYTYHTILIKNSLGCISKSVNILINEPNLPDPDFTLVNPSCGNSGTITFNTVADFYSIDNGKTWSSNNVFSNLTLGYYYLKIKNGSCVSKHIFIFLDNNYLATPKYSVTQPTCSTQGTITINTVADFYSITNGQSWVTNPVFSNLAPGYYYPLIKNANGCISRSSSVNIQAFYLPNPIYTTTQPSCGSAASVTFSPLYKEYSIDGGKTWQISNTFTNLTTDFNYYLVVKDASGCISSPYTTIARFNPYFLPNPDFTVIQPSCGTNGSINIATVADYYSFDGGVTWTTNSSLTNITSGSYSIAIKNALGCKSYNISIYLNPYYLQSPYIKTVQPSCGDGGSITVFSAADSYSFDNGVTWTTNPVLLNPTASYYNIIVKNALGCKSQPQSTYIYKYKLPSPSIFVTQPNCNTPSGSITINTASDQYSFDGGKTWTTNPTLQNLSSGSYSIIIKNSLGCISNTTSAYIYAPPAKPVAPVVKITQPTSCGATDGSITINSMGISYSFNDGNSWTTNPTKLNIGEGTYIVKYKPTSSSCESLSTIVNLNSGTTIAAPSFTTTQPNCSAPKGTITITTNAATYSFDNGLSYVYGNTKTDLSPGTYFIKIKDASGCISDPATVTISPFSDLPAPLYKVTQPNCSQFTGTISIDTVADLYSFDNGLTFGTSNTKTNLSAGTYDVMIKYHSGCISLSTPVTIDTAPTVPGVPKVIVADPKGCVSSLGTITVSTVANQYSFDDGLSWNTDNTASLAPGNYLIRIKNTNGCPSPAFSATINPPENAPSPPSVTVVHPLSCSNPFGSIAITSTAHQYSFDDGQSYSVNPNSGNLAAGTYLIRVKNTNGCESTASSVTINAPTDYPNDPQFTAVQPDCHTLTGTISITDSAQEYSFDNGASWTTNAIQTNLTPDTYYLKVKNNLGCISNATKVTLIPFTDFTPKPTASATQTFCIQQNATIGTINITGQNVQWYDQATNGNSVPLNTLLQNNTSYYASQTINGCESEREAVLIKIQDTPAPLGDADQSFCTNQNPTLNTITVTGTTIQWYNSTGILLPSNTSLTDGETYYATQTLNNCESTQKLAVSISFITSLPANNYNVSFCDDFDEKTKTIDLSSYNPSLIANPNQYEFHYYTSLIGAENQVLSNKIVDFKNYKLSLGVNTLYVRINSNTPCYAISELKFTLFSKPLVPINNIVPICQNTSALVDAGNHNSYLWSTGSTASSLLINQEGKYWVEVEDHHGTIHCTSRKEFEVVLSNKATITNISTVDWTDTENSISVFVTGNGDYEYSIDGNLFQDSNQFTSLRNGKYEVTVKDKNGCGTVSEEVYLLMYPKYFTPNGDGYNDTWNIQFSEMETNITIKIFDRYGKLIKTFISQNDSWDGTYNGRELPATDYWFVVTRENEKEYRGHFSLKR
ncbi:T9SS type B sorting domain-containing protein [Flavobacterium sp. UMI-01]|uniref:T9SS type B sorting domain-containing protein n=1 Tax=Flavobacterium sp. UMI-01 TaxID=1441053 RepID=UPI001C7DB3A4|nr:T9SS type B sorting domain-containing protein [Flavobacterium sp. UMI-01]GIZ09959.1 hypothetical protein FUMI01_26850 [Flavobacterium sp. UMI-01]